MARITTGTIVFATLFCAATLGAQVQQQAKGAETFPCTSPSADARAAFDKAEWETLNGNMAGAAAAAARALAADSTIGLARAFWVYASGPQMAPAQRQAELDRAVSDAAKASEGERLMAASIRAMLLNRPAERDALLDSLVSLAPGNAVTSTLHARFIASIEERVSAMESIEFAHPEFAPVMLQLSYARYLTGDYPGALAAAEKYVKMLPGHPGSHMTLGRAYQVTGRLNDALAEYKRADELDPSFGNGAGMASAAEIYALLGNVAEARAWYTRASTFTPVPADALELRASAAYTRLFDGTTADAVRELTAVATDAEQQGLAPRAASYHRVVALVEAAFGNRNNVATNLTKSAALGGERNPSLYHYTAMAYASMGRPDLATPAAEALKKAAETTPSLQAASHEVQAMLAITARNYATARDELSLAGPAATFGRAMLADALAQSRKPADREEAKALKGEIEAVYDFSTLNALARAKVKGL